MAERNRIVPILILTNVLVYIAWSCATPRFMLHNFSVSFTGLGEGRYWTLLSAEFSHSWALHLGMNMLVLRSFGSLMELVLGRWRFVSFYLTSAVVASLGHALVSAWYLGEPHVPAVGASGAIVGLLVLFSLMFPREKILLFFVVPLPALFGALALVLLDVWGLVSQAGGGGLPIGHGAHLGGALTGLVWFYFVRRSRSTARSPRTPR